MGNGGTQLSDEYLAFRMYDTVSNSIVANNIYVFSGKGV